MTNDEATGYEPLSEARRAEAAWLRAHGAALLTYVTGMATFSPAARIEDIQRKIIEARALLAASPAQPPDATTAE